MLCSLSTCHSLESSLLSLSHLVTSSHTHFSVHRSIVEPVQHKINPTCILSLIWCCISSTQLYPDLLFSGCSILCLFVCYITHCFILNFPMVNICHDCFTRPSFLLILHSWNSNYLGLLTAVQVTNQFFLLHLQPEDTPCHSDMNLLLVELLSKFKNEFILILLIWRMLPRELSIPL